jgi:very-short-patch-repair endonuclease
MKIGLTGTARKLRSETTDAESHLWHALRNRQLNGFKFKRQAPFGPYITDFVCVEARLIVEADGGQRAGQAEADSVRTKYFEEGGYRVMRFWNNDILQNLEGVLQTIASELAEKTPSPQPSPQGEREQAAILRQGESTNSNIATPINRSFL